MIKQREDIIDVLSKLLEEKNKNFIIEEKSKNLKEKFKFMEEKYKIMEIEQKEINKVIKN
jgi:hypothetical protein